MKICALQSFASLVLACLAVDHIAIAEGQQLNTAGTTRVAADTAATTEAKAAFCSVVSVISNVGRKMINMSSRQQVRRISTNGRT
jgi:hypothetical protein